MQDITEYTDQELSLLVMNDESYINLANISEEVFYDVMENTFKYRDSQLKHLKESIKDYKAELIQEKEGENK